MVDFKTAFFSLNKRLFNDFREKKPNLLVSPQSHSLIGSIPIFRRPSAFAKIKLFCSLIMWRISARVQISTQGAGWNFVVVTWWISIFFRTSILETEIFSWQPFMSCSKHHHCASPTLTFQPGLNFECDYIRFIQPVCPANSGKKTLLISNFRKFHPGLKLSQLTQTSF